MLCMRGKSSLQLQAVNAGVASDPPSVGLLIEVVGRGHRVIQAPCHGEALVSTAIDGLEEDSQYSVRVRCTVEDGDLDSRLPWSAVACARTTVGDMVRALCAQLGILRLI